MSDEDRDREERRHDDTRREEEERQRRKRAEDDGIFHQALRSGDYGRWLARRGYESPTEAAQAAEVDEASVLAAGLFDKQTMAGRGHGGRLRSSAILVGFHSALE